MRRGRKMNQRQTSRLAVSDCAGAGALGRLPKNVRRVGLAFQPGLVEFEVVVGNASYCEGEHFYLTADQARRAYSAQAQLAL